VFPAVNFVYSPRSEHNLRLSFSQTVNRPEFREVAPYEFTDVVGGRAVVGNPDLRRSLIQNYDVRYEVFPGAEEVVAASFFFKRFDEPIERIIEPTAQLRTSFTNADSARNVGIELEARRRFTDNFLIGANYTFVDSQVTLSPAAAQVQTSLERALAGQSKNLFNIQVEGRNDIFSARVLYNFFGERISDVGSLGLPDIFEDGRGALDFVFTARLADRINFRFSAENLTDEEYAYTQGGLIQRRFELGRTFSFNFGFSAF
jgi:TonB-dependent receptor